MNSKFKIRNLLFSKLIKLKYLPILKYLYFFIFGRNILNDTEFVKQEKNYLTEKGKVHKRSEIINFIISRKKHQTNYLEIGVRNRADNFNLINSTFKYSVDPAVELIDENHFQTTSDSFDDKLKRKIIKFRNKI